MALVPDVVWLVNFTFRDNNGNTAGAGLNYPGILTYAQVSSQALALAEAIAPLTNAAIDGFAIMQKFVENAPATPAAESEVERKLSLSFGTATARYATSIEIPSPVFTIEQPNTDIVNPTNALLAAFVAEYLGGALGPGNGATTWFGADLTRLTDSVIKHRGRPAKR